MPSIPDEVVRLVEEEIAAWLREPILKDIGSEDVAITSENRIQSEYFFRDHIKNPIEYGELYFLIAINRWDRAQLEAHLYHYYSMIPSIAARITMPAPSLEPEFGGKTYDDVAEVYEIYKKLQPAYQEALAAREEEKPLWRASTQTDQLATAKQRTAGAVARFVNLADLYGVLVTNNARSISKQTDTFLATEAALNLTRLLETWTIENLIKAEDENFILLPSAKDPLLQDDIKRWSQLNNCSGAPHPTKPLTADDLIRSAKRLKQVVGFADSIGVYVNDKSRRFSEGTMESNTEWAKSINDLVAAGYGAYSQEVMKAMSTMEIIDYALWSEIRGSRSSGAGSSDPKTEIGEFYADIAEVLTSIGEGLANAQRHLDIAAMQTQKEIMEDEVLSGYGMSAAWYVMPEAEFNMRLEIGVTAEEKLEINQDGMLMVDSKTKVVAALNNSTYTSLYKVDNKQESSLKIRFVPMPMPDIVKVPDVTELHVMGARRTLAENMIKSLFIGSDGVVWKGTDGVVVAQSVQGGDIMLAEKTLILTVREMQEEEVAEGKINPEFSNIVRLEAVSAIRFDRALTSDLATKINASAVRLNTGDIVGAAKRTDLIKER